MTFLLHRSTENTPPVAVKGEGIYLYDSKGKQYIDACGGAAVSCLGHGHPEVLEALHRQLDKVAYAHTGFFTSEAAEELAETLIDDAPQGLSHVYLVSGGSEAVEAALKMARQYFIERSEPQRRHIITRRQSYHGNTLGALSAGGNEWRRAQFAPLLIQTHHISPCYAYRFQNSTESAEEYAYRAAQELETKILELGRDQVMAFIAEPVVGATSGAVAAEKGYFKRIREICDQYGVLLILDEVMCGMGRTGTLYACEQDGVVPDLLTIAKGLGGGYQPIGAVLLSKELYDAFANGSGFFQHGHTYMAHPMAAAAAVAVQNVLKRDQLVPYVASMESYFKRKIHESFANSSYVGDIRGRGFFLGIELVEDKVTKQTFDPSLNLHTRIKQEALKNGLMVYPMGGTVDGKRGHHVLLAPPFTLKQSDINEVVERLAYSVSCVFSDLGY
ncbi:aspartate aminotransferase family protein [Marinomonas mediterranea]|uniref:Acetylornithine transaminase n=1 Tax=Marinomonas mediterranea (strain ATCC 700492 / JCM 21426 / NBRC 103028 / MMB-1) TaxID=717774 RepID=F2JTU5_MARM1|nr:aspartate aminotransferase family protein [Marinomonas mediterranea]ADZ92715.1 Acetylornithine transaminase [Marinomonas mediterranea MMB-1]WCN14704.1 aspartate aminotransferase family protein [Marinomonas mediterranea]WCN18744.1 aspartate aminotransferase family protein [Marinomonas mediterranea MMB-1]